METLFSIIIPAYNAEKHIKACLLSVVNQTYDNFELIIIDDGSTDNTSKICSNFVINDERIKFITKKKNEGVSIARNKGIENANGKYIVFIDSDDIVDRNLLYVLFKTMASSDRTIDYIRYEFQTIDEKGQQLYPNYESKRRSKLKGKIVDAADCISKIARNEFFLWSGIFRKDIIDKYNILFKGNCSYNEDTLFMVQFFCHSKNHLYIPDVLYGYRKFDGAVTSKFSEKNYNDVRTVFSELCWIYNGKDSDFKKVLRNVIEGIGLRLYNTKEYFNIENSKDKSVFDFCINSPILIEWKLIKILGANIAERFFPLVNFARKIIRRIA